MDSRRWLLASMVALFVGSAAVGCGPQKLGQPCSSHAECGSQDGRPLHCIIAISKEDKYLCAFACDQNDRKCKQGEACYQADCVTPDQGCWGYCFPTQGEGCTPACKDSENCVNGSCEPQTILPECKADPKIRPPFRIDAAAVFDEKRKRVVLFGGDTRIPVDCDIAPPHPIGASDLWLYDPACGTFVEHKAKNAPPGRARSLAFYDKKADRMLLFGGRSRKQEKGTVTLYNDLWALDLETLTWSQLETKGPGPSPRSGMGGGYDPQRGELLIFGGDESDSEFRFAPRNDLWILSLKDLTWRKIESKTSQPSARLLHSVTWDAKGRRLFVFGGGDKDAFIGPYKADLWVFTAENQTWTLLNEGLKDAPYARISATLTYDERSNRILLFGGKTLEDIGNTNDTWAYEFKNQAWFALTKPEQVRTPSTDFCKYAPTFTVPNLHAPERRAAHLAVFDPERYEWLIFGGRTDCGLIDDLWIFDMFRNEWLPMKRHTAGESCFRGDNPGLCKTLCK